MKATAYDGDTLAIRAGQKGKKESSIFESMRQASAKESIPKEVKIPKLSKDGNCS